MQTKESIYKSMQKILHKFFPNMLEQDIVDIIQREITYIPPLHATNIPSKKGIKKALIAKLSQDGYEEAYWDPTQMGIKWFMPEFSIMNKEDILESVYEHITIYEDFSAMYPRYVNDLNIWIAVVFVEASTGWKKLFAKVFTKEMNYTDTFSGPHYWRPSLYMLHSGWMKSQNQPRIATIRDSPIFGLWTEPIEQIIDWKESYLLSKQVDESELDLPTAPVLEDDILQLFNHAVKLIGLIKPNPFNCDEKLSLYGAYKQAICGNCEESKPKPKDIFSLKKWEAWNMFNNMSKKEAMYFYIELIETKISFE